MVAIVSVLGIHKARDYYHCPSCGSEREIEQLRWGLYWRERSFKLFQESETVYISRFCRDWPTAGHAHGWVFWQRSGTYLLGIRRASRVSYGVWSPRWLDTYELDQEFRRWLADQVREGKISKESLAEAASSVERNPPGYPENPTWRSEDRAGQSWLMEYEKSVKVPD